MKILKKIIVLVVIAAVVVGAGGFILSQPMAVPASAVSSREVKEFFTEEGFVRDEDIIDVYPLSSGLITTIYVEENQEVKKGDPICQIDTTQLQYDLDTELNNRNGYLAQIENLDLQELQGKDELRVNRTALQGEYETIVAEESTANTTYLNSETTKEERINLQNLVIEQSRLDLSNAEIDLNNNKTLFSAGIISQQDLENSQKQVDQLRNVLDQNVRQLEVIKTSDEAQNRSEYFQGMKNSINAQIAAIDKQLSGSYNQAMKDYYQSQADNCETSIKIKEKQIEDSTVKAPSDGVITTLNIDKSNIASPEVSLAVISTGFKSLVDVYVPTSEIGYVHLQDMVELELKSDLQTVYNGTVIEIEDKAVVQTSSLGVEKRKVKVVIEPLPEHVANFKAGYDLTASFTTFYADSKLTIPRTAVVNEEDKTYVWVVADGKLQRREIEIELELKTDYAVSSGISEEELVVNDATIPSLEEGKSVVVQ